MSKTTCNGRQDMRYQSFTSSRRNRPLMCALIYGSSVILTACGGGGGGGGGAAADAPSSAVMARLPNSGMPRVFNAPQASGSQMSSRIEVTSQAGSAANQRKIQLRLPIGSDVRTLTAKLDGESVGSAFAKIGCGGAVCMEGLVDLQPARGKHVFHATVRGTSSGTASGRHRLATAAAPLGAMPPGLAGIAQGISMPFLPPTVRFDTVATKGWSPGAGAWFEVNGASYPTGSTPAECTADSLYAAVVLDRQQLNQIGSARCFGDSPSLSIFLASLTAQNLVVVGATQGHNADASLDTASAGGSSMASVGTVFNYMMVGAGQQAPGSAFEQFRTAGGDALINVSLTGTLQEDVNGNYNFQSSDIGKFYASPNDPDQGGSTLAINLPASVTTQNYGVSKLIFHPPAGSGANGMWLLYLDRLTLMPADATSSTITGDTATYIAGVFYPAGNNQAWTDLGNRLSLADDSKNIVVLMSVGTTTPFGLVPDGTDIDQNWTNFCNAAATVGITAQLLGNYHTRAGADYSFVGFRGGTNALTGTSAESSSALMTQGETGFMWGTLQRNNHGLFQISQVSHEPRVVFAAKGGLNSPDFALAETSYQQSVDWPSSSSTALLSGAASLQGQIAAYRFLSHWLLTGFYLRGSTGDHLDDIHYFFPGSDNGSLNVNTKDPADLQYPTSTGTWDDFGCNGGVATNGTCSIQAPGDASPSSFTLADFNAVKAQLSQELIALQNVLGFLETNSTNLKDIVAAGDAGGANALISAATTVLNSKLQNDQPPPPTTKVTFSWQSVLNVVGSVASTLADAEGLGELSETWSLLSSSTQSKVKGIVGLANTIGAALGIVTNGSTINGKSTPSALPSPFVKFTSTLAELSNAALKESMISGFDTLADNILSDWGRLAALNALIEDKNNLIFNPPLQTYSAQAIQAMTTGSAQSYYFALMPSFYQIHWWGGVWYGTKFDPSGFFPYMGSIQGNACHAFYVTPNTSSQGLGWASPYVGVWASSSIPEGWLGQEAGPYEVFVIAGESKNPGTSNTYIPSISDDLGKILFAPDQLNINMMRFVAIDGPMNGAWVNAIAKNPSGWPTSRMCDAAAYSPAD